jgi:hypothetical protein
MANFFFTGGSGGQRAINLDQVREVSQDTATGRISISFQLEHTIALDGGGEAVHGRARRTEVRGQSFSTRGAEAQRPRAGHTEEALHHR